MLKISKGRALKGQERDDFTTHTISQYEQGKSIRRIAQETGRSYGFVHGILSESNTALRPRGGYRGRRKNKDQN